MRKSAYVGMIFLFFFLLAAAGTFFLVVMDIGGTAVDMPARGYLEIPLSGAVSEVAAPDSLSSFLLGAKPLAMYDLWMNLRKAKVDGRIQIVLLRLGLLQCDWAKANEMREAILDFRRSGKKVYAVVEEAPDFDREYFVATACDRIILHPLGWLGINGIGGYVPFLKGAFDKLGIRAEFEHVEEYKTAYNQFTEKGFTPAHREMMESIYGDLFSHYVKAVATARKKNEEEVRSLIDKAFFQGEEALKAGLVDDLLYEDQLQNLLQSGGRKLGRITSDAYARVSPVSAGIGIGRRVALIYGVGPILSGESLPQSMGGTTVARWIRQARQDKSIAAIVFRVDSPGGSSVASDVIWREVFLAKKEKPFVVSMSDVAGSGGYWISMAAHKIVAQPQTLTGSIGVLAGKFDLSALYEKLGLTSEKIAYGKEADIFSTFRPFSPEEKKIMKDEILWTYDQFLTKVAEGRNMTKDEVNAVGRGRVWTGAQARDLKLVDELGGLTKAVELAKGLAGIAREEEVRLVVWPKKRTFWGSLFGRRVPESVLDMRPGLKQAALALRLMERTRVWAVMPFWSGPE